MKLTVRNCFLLLQKDKEIIYLISRQEFRHKGKYCIKKRFIFYGNALSATLVMKLRLIFASMYVCINMCIKMCINSQIHRNTVQNELIFSFHLFFFFPFFLFPYHSDIWQSTGRYETTVAILAEASHRFITGIISQTIKRWSGKVGQIFRRPYE